MASGPRPPQFDEEGPPPERPAGEPVRDLYPTMDARFILVEIGKLTSMVERLIKDVSGQGDKIDTLRHQVTFVKGAIWVAASVFAAAGAIGWLYMSGKVSIAFH